MFILKQSSAVCFQIILEYIIFLFATLLWLTWCSNVYVEDLQSEKSLGFSLPGYILGWVSLMICRLVRSRLREKFCFSFYLMSGIRFMISASFLYPTFTKHWFPIIYGVISVLCFLMTILHIAIQTDPIKLPVRRLIDQNGNLQTPVVESMSIQQLEGYRDIIRVYMEKRETEQNARIPNKQSSVTIIHLTSHPKISHRIYD